MRSIRIPIVSSLAKACGIQRVSSGMGDGAGIRGIVVTALFTAFALVGSTVFSGPPVAPTEPLSAQEQMKKFKLPPGFSIQLVASEPQIQKPMNLAFDARRSEEQRLNSSH